MTAPLFVFGTLRHRPLLEAIVGDTASVTFAADRLPGYAVNAVQEGPFPMIVADCAAFAEGLLLTGLSHTALDALDFYESTYGYLRRAIHLESGADALAYFPPDMGVTPIGPWSLEHWAETWGDISTKGAHEVAQLMQKHSAAEVRAMFPMIWARAASSLRAQDSKHGVNSFSGTVEVETCERAYSKFFAMNDYKLRHSRFDGTFSDTLDRGVLLSPDVALVLPYDPKRDRVLLVEQFRMGPLVRGDRHTWQLEPVAGRIDAGETPQEAARREAEEEAGLKLDDLYPVAEVYASPGTSSEFYYVYLGIADLPTSAEGIGGLASENEDIRSHVLPFEELMALCDSQQAANTPLVVSAYWLARHRARLRSDAGVSGVS
ncbi:MAG: NUDIX domain-containing protein [Pseudomonadota bacterium]